MKTIFDPFAVLFKNRKGLRFKEMNRHLPLSTALKLVLVLAFLLPSLLGSAFTTKWKTTAANESITIQTFGTGYNYTIDWGDGTIEPLTTGNPSHVYVSAGTHTITITGDFPRIFMNGNAADRNKLVSIDSWGSIQWTTMQGAFRNCDSLVYNATDAPNLSGVTDLTSMFQDCDKFDGDLSNWNVSTITNMASMFASTGSFNGNITNWDVSAVTNMSSMFSGADAFNQPLNSWDVSLVQNFIAMFFHADAFNQPLNNWNMGSATNLGSMFSSAIAFNSDISGWNLPNVTSIERMFSNNPTFNQPIDDWTLGSVTNMFLTFFGATAFNQPLNSWDVSTVTNFNSTFSGATAFNQPLNNWNVGAAQNMENMFLNASAFNGSMSGWNLPNVTTMRSMFRGAVAFNQPIDDWTIGNVVTNMISMFEGADAFNQPLNSWNVSSVQFFQRMFVLTDLFNQPLNNWDMTSATSIGEMFGVTQAFNSDISGWDLSNVTDMQRIFFNAVAFNQPLNSWAPTTGGISNMFLAFSGATAFDQSLGSWDVTGVTNMNGMLINCGMSITSYDNTLIGWEAQAVKSNVTLSANGLEYCAGETARNNLVANSNWNITGDSPETGVPVAVCSPSVPVVFLDATGNGTLAENALALGASNDACSAVTETSPLTNFDCSHLGIQPVLLTATDNAGNMASVNCDVIIADDIAPEITFCPADVTVTADPGACGATNVNTGTATATDNCPGVLPVLINGTTPPFNFLVGERGALLGGAGGLTGVFHDGTRQIIANIHAADGVVMESATSVIVSRFNPAGANLRKVDLITNVETDLASLGGLIQGMSINTAGNLLVTNEGLDRIQELDITTGAIISEITGFNRPIDVVEETATTLLISEYALGQIVRYDLNTSTMSVLSTGHVNPTDILLDGMGNAYVAENGGAVSSVNLTTGARTVVVNVGGGGFGPHGMALDNNGDLLITLFSAGEIKRWDGSALTTFATGLNSPVFIVKAPENIFPVGINQVVWTAEDASGNIDFCVQTITVDGMSSCGNDAQVLDFDGVDDYVDLGIWNPHGAAGFTHEAWVYAENLGPDNWSNSVILQEGPTGTSTILRCGENGANNVRASFHYGPTSSDLYDLNGVITTNDWHHLAMTWSAADDMFYLYVDGVLADQISAPNPPNSVSEEIWIGNSEVAPDRWWDGRLDEIRVWDHPRTQGQIQALMTKELNGTEPGLLAYYNFNQGQAFLDNTGETTLNDFNGNHNGTLNNFALAIGDNSNWIEPGPLLGLPNSTGFVTTWEVDASDLTIQWLTGHVGYEYSVNWGDGIIDEGLTGPSSHTYDAPGVYTVSIDGDFPYTSFTHNHPDRLKLKSIEQWGDIQWTSMLNAFSLCENMVYNATDAPDLSQVTNMHAMFVGCTNFDGDLSNWDVSNVTDVSFMFRESGFNGDVSTWNTSNITRMDVMFWGSQFDQDISNWDVSNVTNLNGMFALCPFNQPLSNWERVGSTLGNVQSMINMFSGNVQFNQDINNWNVGGVTHMGGMFYRAHAFNQPLNSWDVSSVNYMNTMFQEASSFDQNLSSWNTGSVISMASMFATNPAFSQDISMWDVSNVSSFAGMFNGATAWDYNLAAWNITSATNMFAMLSNSGMSNANYDATLIGWGAQDAQLGVSFGAAGKLYCAGELERQHLIDEHGWNITHDARDPGCAGSPPPPPTPEDTFVTTWQADGLTITIPTQSGLTYDYNVDWGDGVTENGFTGDATHNYTTGGIKTVKIWGTFPSIYFNNAQDDNINKIRSIEAWGDIAWEDMTKSFAGCINMVYNAVDAPDLSNVTSTNLMFTGCHGFKTGGLSNWDMSNVTDISYMFSCSDFNGDVSGWNTSSITNMAGVFNVSHFNGAIGDWDVSNVTTMYEMFRKSAFNQDIGGWDVSNVTDMRKMFWSNVAFNQDIGDWDVTGVNTLYEMFHNADAFNQDIGTWDVSNVVSLERMFTDADGFNQDISGWDVSNVTNMRQTFKGATAFNQSIVSWDVSSVERMDGMFFFATSFDQNIGGWDMSACSNVWEMFNFCGMGVENYDNTISGWSSQVDIMPNLSLGANGMKFCNSESARDFLRDGTFGKGWTFNGDAIDADCTGSCNCNPNTSPMIPNTAAGIHTATVKCEDGDFTHFCNSSGQLMLSISSAEASSIPPSEVTVNVVPGTQYYPGNCVGFDGDAAGNCFVTNPSGWTFFCRTWDVNSTETNAGIRYYIDDADLEIINEGIADDGLQPKATEHNLWMYKDLTGAFHPKPDDLFPSDIQIVGPFNTRRGNGGTPSFQNYVVDTTAQNYYSLEYIVATFSGGGGGGGGDNGSGMTCPAIEADISGSTVLAAPGNGDVFVNITGGTAPYDIGLSDGTMVSGYTPGDPISVFASEPTDFFVTTAVDAANCPLTAESTGQGSIYFQSADDTPPFAICQDVSVDLNSYGTATITVEDIDDASFDNDSIASFALNVSTFDCTSGGSDIVTLTVTDASGNSESCTAMVTINDPLVVCCPAVREVPNTPLDARLYEADQQITSDAEIQLGSGSTNIIFEAGNNVQLNAGFTVEQGAVFEAKIGPCGAN